MSYKSPLKGWAWDRALEFHKLTKSDSSPPDFEDVKRTADAIVEYAYEPEKEFQDCIQVISQILKETPDAADALAKIDQLQAELGALSEDIHRQTAVKNAGNKQIREVTKKGAH